MFRLIPALFFAAILHAQSTGVFAFPDLTGKRLLVTSELSQPADLHTALCTGNTQFPVKFERLQTAREDGNHRQSANNFDHEAGSVFTVTRGRAAAGATCFLAENGADSVTLKPPPASCAADIQRRAAAERHRSVVHCWPLQNLPPNDSIVLMEFERQDTDAMASVVVAGRDRMIFADYHAVFRGEGQDLWRVEDGGVLSPEGIQIVFVIRRKSGYSMGVAWHGAEGLSLTLFESDGSGLFTQAAKDYWYRAPL